MKRVLTFFLLSIFLFNTMGYFVVFKIGRDHIKRALKQDIENGILHTSISTIVIPNTELNDLSWLEHDEFEYNHERYDVLRIAEDENSTTFYCIHDKKETHLFSKLSKHVKDHVAQNKQPFKHSKSKNILDNSEKILESSMISFASPFIFTEKVELTPPFSTYKFQFVSYNFQPPETT
ncbi:MAG TPA: hypothetical protein VF868_07805 [Bacteroidia bacterium]|jgi:hypothetical protein